jgi:hypothetical protein
MTSSVIKDRRFKRHKKSFFNKIGNTGKIIAGMLGFIIAISTCWQLYKTYSTKNISGKWKLKFVVEKCNHKAFIGENHTQITMFSQTDKTIIGKGEKWEYNGKILNFDMHRKIEYTGAIDGSKLNAIYVLHGRDRDSEGNILVTVSNDGRKMEGTYSGTIGNDSGTVTGERMD